MELPAGVSWDNAEPPPEVWERIEGATRGVDGLSSGRLMVLGSVMLALSRTDKPDFERGSTVTEARELIALYASSVGLLGPARKVVRASAERPIAEFLRTGLLRRGVSTEALRAINAALIVCADHELSPSTLARAWRPRPPPTCAPACTPRLPRSPARGWGVATTTPRCCWQARARRLS